jgi:NADP-dependent 3-hydroxy acid dehydrogenase YdfG
MPWSSEGRGANRRSFEEVMAQLHQNDLRGHVALITGASRGIGEAIARKLAAAGMHLVLTARSEEPLQALADELTETYSGVCVMVRNPAEAQAIVDETLMMFGRIDALINNAGVAGKIALLHEIPVEEIDRTIDTNLKAPAYWMKFVLPSMIQHQHGTIININSVAGKTAFPYWSIYDASKFGLHALTTAVGEEQRSNHIRVAGIYPGAVDTPIWNTIELNHEPKRDGMLNPEDVANAVLYLLAQPQGVYIPEITLAPLQPAL